MPLARRALLPLVAALVAIACLPTVASAATRTVCASGCDFTTVGAAVAAASNDDVISIGAGTYTENVAVGKRLTIAGAGSASTTLRGNAAITLQPGGSGSSIEDLTIQGSGGVVSTSSTALGVAAGAVNAITLEGVVVTGAYRGLYVPGSATTDEWEITSSTFTGNTTGAWFHGATTDLSIADSHFDGNDFGLYTQYAAQGATNVPGVFDGVTILDSTFNDNAYKGMYFEALSNAAIARSEVDGTGTVPALRPSEVPPPVAGIDVNLKYGAFSTVVVAESRVTDTLGTGMQIKARNDSGRYATTPATLTGVFLSGLTVTGSQAQDNPPPEALGHGVAVGYAVRQVSISGSRITGNAAGGLLSYADDVVGSEILATENWWGSNAGPGDAVVVQPGKESVDADPWVVMGIAADPAEIPIGGAESTIAVDFDELSDGSPAADGIPDGAPIAFATDLGSIDPAVVETCGCIAESTLTSGATPGTAHVTATLDGQTVETAVAFRGPSATLTPATFDFGAVTTGTTSGPQAFTLTNDGLLPVEVDDVALDGPDGAGLAVTGETCTAAPIGVGDTCVVEVSFAPAAAGARSATLRLTGDFGEQAAALQGTGVAPVPPAPGTATIDPASSVTDVSAVLSGTIAASNAPSSTWRIELSRGPGFGGEVVVVASGTVGRGGGAVGGTATGLDPSTTYSARVAVSSAGGTNWSAPTTFTTAGAPSTNPDGPGTNPGGGSGPGGEPSSNPAPRAERLTLRVSPDRDREAPFEFRTRGRLVMSDGSCPAGGVVTVELRRRGDVLGEHELELGRGCRYDDRVVLLADALPDARGRINVIARFDGGRGAGSARSEKVSVRYG